MPRRENCRQDALTTPLEFFVRGYSGCCGCTICHYHFLLLFSLFFAGEFCWPPRRGHWCALRFHPIYSGRQACGRTSRGHTGGRSHSISHPPSFCGACLNFSRGKDSAVQELKKTRRDITSVYGGRYRGRIIMTKQKNKEKKTSCAAQ